MSGKLYNDVSSINEHFSSLYGTNADGQSERYEKCFNNFKQKYNANNAYIASSPGRVEVCGNHTDHNGGVVMSCAISLDTLAFFLPTDDNIVTIESEGYGEFAVDLNDLTPKNKSNSAELVRGVAFALKDRGYKIGGFKAYCSSNVNGGAGISSSASFEVLIAEIFNFLYNDEKIDNQTKAIVSQFAENVYFNKPCGLLDQTAIAFGGLKMLDFKTEGQIKVTSVEDNIKDFTFVLINTGGSHEDLTDEYAAVPLDMKTTANKLGKNRLIEISKSDFINSIPTLQNTTSCKAILRCMHFYTENERVIKAVVSVKKGDLFGFMKEVNDSGLSSLWQLQNCSTSCQEQLIPLALSLAKSHLINGVARVHGGGFAGCILCVVKNNEVKTFIENMSKFYDETNIIPLCVRESGTIII